MQNKSNLIEKLKSSLYIKLVLSLYISYLLVRGSYIVRGYTGSFLIRFVFLIPLTALIIYVLLTVIYDLFDRIAVKRNEKTRSSIKPVKVLFISFIILMIFYTAEFSAFYPGMFNFDGPGQLYSYLNGRISEANPLLHTLIIAKIILGVYSLGFDITTGIAVYTIFQYSVIALCLSYMLKYVYRKCGMCIWIISVGFLALFPTITLQVMSSTKDSFFMGFFILFLTLTLELYEDSGIHEKEKMRSVAWVVSAFLILVFRNNCILALPVMAIALMKISKNKRGTLIRLVLVILLFLCYKFIFARSIVNVDYDTRELFSVPAQQMAAIYLEESSELTAQDRLVMERFLGDNLDMYIPEIADVVKISLDMDYYRENSGLVLKVWLKSVMNNPKTAWRAFSQLNSGYWYPINDLTLYWDGTKGYWPVGSLEPYYIESKCIPLTYFYLWFSTTDFSNKLLVPVYLLFAPATYFFIFVIIWGYVIRNKRKPAIATFVFVFFYWATYLLGPVALVRYVSFLYAMLPIYFPLIFMKDR